MSSSFSSSSPSSSSGFELRLLIDNSAVGAIIGKSGGNVKRIRDETGAFVSILKSDVRNVQERICVLKGDASQIAAASKLVAENIESGSRSEESGDARGTVALKLLVHKSGVGAVIGKGGEVIKSTQEGSGARVQVSNEPLQNSSEKTITITGQPQQIQEAVNKIAAQLIENPLKPGTKVYPYVPGAYPSYQAPSYGAGAFGINRDRNAAPGVLSTQKIGIPSICAGTVIGKGGQVIRDLRAQTGTNISIADAEDNSTERVVTLSGTPAGISHAVFLIRQLVESYQPANTNF